MPPRKTTTTTKKTAETVDRKAEKRGSFEPRSGMDPTIDASAGEKARKDQLAPVA